MTYRSIAIIILIFSTYFVMLPYYTVNKYGKNYNETRQKYGMKNIADSNSYHWTKYNIKVRFELEKSNNFLLEKELGFRGYTTLYTEADCYTINADTMKYEIVKGVVIDKIMSSKGFYKMNTINELTSSGEKVNEKFISESVADSIINYYESTNQVK